MRSRTLRYRSAALSMFAASTLLLAACGGAGGDSGGSGGGADDGRGDAALVVAQGGLGDQSYNDLAKSGFDRALEETGLQGTPIQSDDIVGQGEQILRRAGQAGYGLLIDLEFSHGEILPQVAADFPDADWAIVNTTAEGDNVASVLFQEQQGSFLAGALAAMMTTHTDNPKINEEKVIGVIGGTKSVGIDKFLAGYVQGARYVDDEVEVEVAYSDTFGDPAKGKQMAATMYSEGADIVYAVAGGTGSGVIEAAEENDRYAIGVDTNQDGLAPGHVLTSMVKHTDRAVADLVTAYAQDEFPGGETLTLGLAEGGVGLTDFQHTRDEIPAEYLDRVEQLREEIVDGEIEVWNVVEQGYPSWFQG